MANDTTSMVTVATTVVMMLLLLLLMPVRELKMVSGMRNTMLMMDVPEMMLIRCCG